MARLPLALAVVVLLGLAPSASAQLPGGLTSDNVEFVTNFARHADTAGGRLFGGHYYVTTERDLSIYDVKNPEAPVLTGNAMLASPGEPTFTEEDPDTNGRILIVSNSDFMVYDVSDKRAPKLLSTLPGVDQHTFTCVLDCTWAYGSSGAIVDLRDPKNPKDAGTWNDKVQPRVTSSHDVTEISPGILVTATEPLLMLDVRADPTQPKVLATGKTPGFAHAALWPGAGQDDFLLVGGEKSGPQCSEDEAATFMTMDTRNWTSSKSFTLIDQFRLSPGTPADGTMPDSTWCVHWFAEHPTYANGGLVAVAWYEQGTRFLKVDGNGKLQEIGYYLPVGGQASDVDWITDKVAYVADYTRGVDVIKFTGPVPAGRGRPAAPGSAPVAAAPATPTASRRQATIDQLVTWPKATKRCVRAAAFTVRARRFAADPVAALTLRVDGRRAASAAGSRLRRGLRPKRLPRGRFSVQVQARTRSGHTTAGQRSYRGC